MPKKQASVRTQPEAKTEERASLTAEEIAELKILLDQVEKTVKLINAPLAFATLMGTIWSISKITPLVDIIKSLSNQLDRLENDTNQALAYALFALLFLGAMIGGVYFASSKIHQIVDKFFPKGFLEPFDYEIKKNPATRKQKIFITSSKEPAHWKIAKELLKGQNVERNITDIIKKIKLDLENNLMPKANALMAFLVGVNLLSKIFSFHIPKSDIFYGLAIRQFYYSRDILKNLWRRKMYRKLVNEQIENLKKLSLSDAWETIENKSIDDKDKKYEHAIFKLRHSEKYMTIQIPTKDGLKGAPCRIKTTHYLSELITILEKANVKVLAEGCKVLSIGSEILSNKKVIKLRKEFSDRLRRRVEVEDNKLKKLEQLKKLIAPVLKLDVAWHFLPKRDSHDFATSEFVISSDAIQSEFKTDFFSRLTGLYGPIAIEINNSTITVRGHLLCDDLKLSTAVDTLKYLVEKSKSPASVPANEQSTSKPQEPSSIEFILVKRIKNKRDNVESKQKPLSEVKQIDATSQILKALKLNADEKLFPLQVPWAPGKELYYAVVDSKKYQNELGKGTYGQFEGYFQEGSVHEFGGKGVGLFPCDKKYKNFASKSGTADFQAKNTRNIRLFGKIEERLVVNGERRNIVRFDGYTLRAH